MTALVIEVRLHADRYYGRPEWPPAPARLFQALVAGAARGASLTDPSRAALAWLERLAPPIIASPPVTNGQRVTRFVPNNDLDGKDARGDPALVDKIRVGKTWQPRLIEGQPRLLYAWSVTSEEATEAELAQLREVVEDLYQLGRGIDLAWATARVVDRSELESMLAEHHGTVHRPTPGEGPHRARLTCPISGSLQSLIERHQAAIGRLVPQRIGRKDWLVFGQPPKARFVEIGYDTPPERALFELRSVSTIGGFAAVPLAQIATFAESIRDAAARRLSDALPGHVEDIEQALIGRTPEGRRRLSPQRRVWIRPLPSIGHEHTHAGVRRVLVDVPGDCPLRADDVFWAFSGLATSDDGVLTRSEEHKMASHYGVERPARKWSTITAAALPDHAGRRRITPRSDDTKSASERAAEEERAAASVKQALRHGQVARPLQFVRVQREPFSGRGARAEDFAEGTRFDKHRLWHVEITFSEPVAGPLTIGDGRYLGLGLMHPAGEPIGAHAFQVVGGLQTGQPAQRVAEALRRAVMARAQRVLGDKRSLPAFFTGHDRSGRRAQGHRHLTFVFDPVERVLLVLAPRVVVDREPRVREPFSEQRHVKTLENALAGFIELYAGRAGVLQLAAADVRPFGVSRAWVSRTPYVVRRHEKKVGAERAVVADVRGACAQAGLPKPEVRVGTTKGVSGIGLTAEVAIEFPTEVRGPISLGRTRHIGGGWFVPRGD